MLNNFISRISRKKPLEIILAEETTEGLARELRLFDLLCIGIGGTVGTGIFATAGEIISEDAGPAATISWLLGGFACCLSGFSYMELTSRIPSSGSCYAYSYHVLGELPAFIAAFLLTLEYAVSGAGVARVWSFKLVKLLSLFGIDISYINHEYADIVAFSIQTLAAGSTLR